MKEKNIITLYSNYDIFESYPVNEYIDMLIDNDEEIDFETINEDSQEYIDWVYESSSLEWEDFLANIETCKSFNDKWYADAVFGLWYGERDGYATFDNLKEAIQSTLKDCDYVEITKERNGNHIHISATHHDGTNNFDLYALTDDGYERQEEDGELDLADESNFKELDEYLF